MRILLANETGSVPHLGCRAVADGHARLLGRAGHAVADRLFLNALRGHEVGDDRDVVAAIERDTHLMGRVAAVDAVVVNGEGTIHHGAGRGWLGLLQAAQNMGKLTLIVLGFTALLLIIAIALINNTIRLAIYSKRFLIRTMHLVGATQWFIKRPFMGQSLWQGLLGGVLAIGLLVGLLQLAQRYMPDLLAFTDAFRLGLLFVGVLALGLLISLASTWFAVGRYLRMNSEDLHWS